MRGRITLPGSSAAIKYTTARIIDKLSDLNDLKSDDANNLTPASRDAMQYADQLNINLKRIIISRFNEVVKKVKLLDAGCGKGVAINDLLSNSALNDYLESCTGVSKHYFANIELVLKKHGKRFNYIYGKAQAYLSELTNTFDIILDLWGAYFYSIDKIELLRLYHQALLPNGTAVIVLSRVRDNIIVVEGQKTIPLITRICGDYPETFKLSHNTCIDGITMKPCTDFILTITKKTEHFPLPTYTVQTFDYCRTANPPKNTPAELVWSECEKGNAVAPFQVRYRLQKTPTITPDQIALWNPQRVVDETENPRRGFNKK